MPLSFLLQTFSQPPEQIRQLKILKPRQQRRNLARLLLAKPPRGNADNLLLVRIRGTQRTVARGGTATTCALSTPVTTMCVCLSHKKSESLPGSGKLDRVVAERERHNLALHFGASNSTDDIEITS